MSTINKLNKEFINKLNKIYKEEDLEIIYK
jgi:hypothetical protein